MTKSIKVTVADYTDHSESNDGICIRCGEWTAGGVEPDARGYLCEACGKKTVIGAEEALMVGVLEIATSPVGPR